MEAVLTITSVYIKSDVTVVFIDLDFL